MMQQTPEKLKISILMPVYNAENYLRAALDSVLGQTLPDIELICVDDGSTDGSLAILEEYAARDGRVTVLRHAENQGTLVARKHCMQAARGQYVMWLDPDDTLTPDACEAVWNEMRRSPADVLQFGVDVVLCGAGAPSQTKESLPKRWEPCLEKLGGDVDLIKACWQEHKLNWNLCNKAFRNTVCEAAWPFVEERRITVGEDEYIFFLLLYFAQSYRGISKQLYRYNLGYGVSLTEKNTLTERRFSSLCTLGSAYALMETFLRERNQREELRRDLQAARNDAMTDAVWKWMRDLTPEAARATYPALLENFGAEAVISALARWFWREEEDVMYRMAPDIRLAGDAPRPAQKVQSIAVYAGAGEERVLRELGYRVTSVAEQPTEAQDGRPACAFVPRAAGETYALRAEAWRQLIERDAIDTVLYAARPTETCAWDIALLKGLRCNVVVRVEEPFALFARQDPRRYSFVQSLKLADAAMTDTRLSQTFWQNVCPTYALPAPDAPAVWREVLGAVGSGAAAMPQTPTDEQRMVNAWLDAQRSGEGDARTRREMAYMRNSKLHKAVRLWLKCKDKGQSAVRKIRRKLGR